MLLGKRGTSWLGLLYRCTIVVGLKLDCPEVLEAVLLGDILVDAKKAMDHVDVHHDDILDEAWQAKYLVDAGFYSRGYWSLGNFLASNLSRMSAMVLDCVAWSSWTHLVILDRGLEQKLEQRLGILGQRIDLAHCTRGRGAV